MDFIFQFGAPKEVRVKNVIVEAGLEQLCNVCGIKIRREKSLQGLCFGKPLEIRVLYSYLY